MATLEQRIKKDYANYCKDGQIQTEEVRDCIRKNGADIDDAGAARLLIQIAGADRRMSEQKFADGIKNFILFGWEAPQNQYPPQGQYPPQEGQYPPQEGQYPPQSQYNPQISQSQYNPQQPPNQYNPQLSQSQYKPGALQPPPPQGQNNPQLSQSQYNPQQPPSQYNPQQNQYSQRPPYLQQSQQQPPYLQRSQYQPGQPPYPPQGQQPGQPPYPPQGGGPPLVANPGATSPHPEVAARLNDFYRQAAADGRIDAHEVVAACGLYNIRLDIPTASSLLAIVAQPDRRITQEKFVYHIGIYCTKYMR